LEEVEHEKMQYFGHIVS